MEYNPKKHKRRSIRLKGYDYAQKGLYFVTICCQNRKHFYGKIENGIMILNDAGKMIEKWYYELENKFPDIKCHEMVVMPNHFHCIIENVGIVGTDLRVCPITKPTMGERTPVMGERTPVMGERTPVMGERTPVMGERTPVMGEHVGSPLHRMVQWFKTMSTNEYIRGVKTKNWKRFDGKLWQRNYWEHIIRNETSYHKISKYIKNNPLKWEDDSLF